jgi:TonB-linked SusC/RagA family outer membrane protein
MKKSLVSMLILFFIGLQGVLAQSREITGMVTSAEDGLSIPGVSVIVKGTTIGTTTDLDGKYSLNVPEDGQILIFSFVGMQMQEVEITSSTINVVMETESIGMDEVVVVGYTAKAKDEIASAVSTVTAEQLSGLTPTTSVDNMLQGKAAGVEATALNGKPGTTATVKVRGAVSLNTKGGDKSQPLYVVDGIFLDGDDLGAINPSDIETMSVLKDASAAAIYGSRGANGVVVITTKTGKINQAPRISFSARVGYGKKIDDEYKMMNTEQKIRYEEELVQFGKGRTWSEETKATALKNDHDWQDDILKKAKIESYNLSATGGSEKSTYYMSLGYDKNTGIIENLDGYERISGRLNYNNQMTEKLKVGSTMSVSYSTSAEPRDRNNVQNPFNAMYGYSPYETVYRRDANNSIVLDENGDPVYNLTHFGFSILEALKNNPEEERNIRAIGGMDLTYEFNKNISFKTKISGTYDRYQREAYTQPGSVLDGYVGDPAAPGSKRDNGSDTFEYTWLNQLSFNKEFGDHKVDGLVFTEFTKNKWHSYTLASKGYASSSLTTQDNSSEATDASTTREDFSLFSIAAAANYSYLGKYMVSASVRRDGASRFGKDEKYGIFWSGSLAWNIHKEDFFNIEFVDHLKTRVSYGTLGSWDIPNYASLGYYGFNSYDGQSAAVPKTNIGNLSLTWEEQSTFDFGVEYSLFRGRLNGAMDYFVNTRTEFLFENPLSYEGGSYTQFTNAGKMQTKGFEFELSGDVVKTSDFKWNLGLNMTFLDYEVKKLNGQEQIIVDGNNILKEGETPFTFYMPRYAGVNPDNGEALYYDKDGKVTNVFSSGNSVALSGKSPLADMYGGLRSTFTYKGVDLSADFSFKEGNYVYNYVAYYQLSDADNWRDNQRVDAFNYWKKPGDTNVLPKPNQNTNQVTDRFLQDGSYIRFRSLTLGYTLPMSIVEKINLTKVRFYIQAQNLHTWTDFEGDPEVSVGSGENQLGDTQDFIPGAFALYSYPATRSIMFGVDIKF